VTPYPQVIGGSGKVSSGLVRDLAALAFGGAVDSGPGNR
jgi:hypothetical protein